VIGRNTAFTYKGKAVDLAVFATAMPETADTTAERTPREKTAGSPPQPIAAD
jgi:hypothetical protein